MKLRLSALAAAMTVSLTAFSSCNKEEPKNSDEILSELESKYEREFELVSEGENVLTFKDENELEFKVNIEINEGWLFNRTIKYRDDYITQYIAEYHDTYFAGLTSAGIEEKSEGEFSVSSYDQLDVLFEEVNKLSPPVNNVSYIYSKKLTYYCGDIKLGDSGDYENTIRQNYLDKVREGAIKEELTAEKMQKYPAKELEIYINGNRFKGGKAYIQKNTGKACIELMTDSKNDEMLRFIRSVVGLNKNVRKEFEPQVIDVEKNINKPAGYYYSWDGGKLDLFYDELPEKFYEDPDKKNGLMIRFYPEDIERLFNADMSADPAITGRLLIDRKQ